jgi:prefoldin subunit 5
MKQLEKELEPLRAELANVRQRMTELMQRKGAIENDMKELQ